VVAGNQGVAGNLYVLDETSLVSIHETLAPGAILGVTASDSYVWFITTSGVYGFDPLTGDVSSLLRSGSYTCLEYEAATGHLYLGKQDGVERITTSGILVEDVAGITGVTSRITFVMNK
jgi:hypothetical protein